MSRITIELMTINYKALFPLNKAKIEARRLAAEIAITLSQVHLEGPHVLARTQARYVKTLPRSRNCYSSSKGGDA